MKCRSLHLLLADMGSSGFTVQGVEGNFPINTAVLHALPEDTRIIRANCHGVSNIWYLTGVIEALDRDGRTVKYFAKYSVGNLGRILTRGEIHAMSKIQGIIPDAVPTPIAWGMLDLPVTCEGSFYLATFVEFESSDLPDPSATAEIVARLHASSLGTSQLFGSPVPMYDGLFCHLQGWERNWRTLFSRMLWQAYSFDRSINGRWEELDVAISYIVAYVAPRLLDDLDKSLGGIKPCFVHGDLWEGNIGQEVHTGKHFLFDSNGYYGHNEVELTYWRTKHHKMSSLDYCAEYFKRIRPSEPASEVEDRIKLYGVKACLMYAANEGKYATRARALHDMNYLLRKYAPEHSTGMPWTQIQPRSTIQGFPENDCENERSAILEEIFKTEAGGESGAHKDDACF
ncbi:Fructosamine kinase-domain-containing protein [Diplogelasinospora grovesii]|uniref:protein-ribulosamine 3-kinase n=1 Tax=Diplogelasinospora grovesii TaxID=303347 RepID=A0AAN6RZX7_9PEZI|nr:Fructosamine kinase-domain-containing protein [Diplogelasinospora grovesii]